VRHTDAAWALKMAIHAVWQEVATYSSLASMHYVKLK